MESVGNLTPAQLVDFLKSSSSCSDVEQETFDMIIKNKVSGKRATKYVAEDWQRIGLPYGDIKDIMDAIVSVKENSPPCHPPSETITSSIAISSPSPNVTSRSPVLENPPPGKYDCLVQYFDEEEFSEMPEYEKESYLNSKENYEYGQTLGLKIGAPSFMKPKPQLKTKTSNKQVALKSFDFGPSSSRTLRKRPSPSPTPTKADVFSSYSEDSDSRDIEVGSKHKDGEGSKDSDVDEGQLHNAEERNQENSPRSEDQPKRKRKRRKRSKPYEHLSDEDFAKKLPKFEVFNILKSKGRDLKDVCSSLSKERVVYGPARKLMMRTLTNHLYYDDKGNLNTVTTDQKSGMAASIVSEYPLFKDETDPKKRSWWRIFDPAGPSGFIANCTTSIFRRMNPEDRLRGGGRSSLVEVSEDEEEIAGPSNRSDFHDKDAEWMSLTMPNQTKKTELFQGMEVSFTIRRQWIENAKPTVTDILKKYIHLMSYDAEMLEKEFSLMFPSKGPLFLKNFPRLMKLVKDKDEIESVEGFDDVEAKDVIGTCLTLAKKLPRPNLQRYRRKNESVMPTVDSLILTIPIGTNVKGLIEQKRKDANSPVQPYIIALKPAEKIIKMFIVADSEVIQLKRLSVVAALDVLFKSYFVFNVQYPLGWTGFWEMVERGLCHINHHKLSSSAKELLALYKFKFY